MARQNTFIIVPPPGMPVDSTTTPMRPMTSRQVRRAHLEATRAPKMTRAERQAWEREQQARIRSELERDRTAARARAAREKKRDREAREREEKRRRGAPLVSVRSSQDTITRFVRGNGSMKKRDGEGEVVEAWADKVQEKEEEEEELRNGDQWPGRRQARQEAVCFVPEIERDASAQIFESSTDPYSDSDRTISAPSSANLVPRLDPDQQQQPPSPPLSARKHQQQPQQMLPTRFFTSSGSREKATLALQRSSRRPAPRTQLQERERQQQQRQAPPPAAAVMGANGGGKTHSGRKRPFMADKENIDPETAGRGRPQGDDGDEHNGLGCCSQETDYGGDWLDEAALNLVL